MKIDWDSIKYIFQIPVRWYREISNKVDKAYGKDFIKVRQDGMNDGLEIGVDKDLFERTVKDIAGEPEDGWVKTVDGRSPDAQGNVATGSVKSINGEYFPDPQTGDVQINVGDGTVKSVDNVMPDSRGNVNLGALTATDITTPGIVVGPTYTGEQTVCSPSHKHKMSDIDDMSDKTFVEFVDGISPQANGNVVLNAVNLDKPQTITGPKTYTSSITVGPQGETGATYGQDGITYPDDATIDADGQILLGKQPEESTDEDDLQIATVGYVNKNVGKVKTVDNVEPDSNGNIDLSNKYASKDHVHDEYAPIDHMHTHQDITDWSNATKDFLQSDDITTPGIVVGTDYAGEQTVCSPNHKHDAKDIENLEEGYVTLSSEQTITGHKTFKNDIDVRDSDGSMFLSIMPNTNVMALDGREASGIRIGGGKTTGFITAGLGGFSIDTLNGGLEEGGGLTFKNSGTTLKQTGDVLPLTLDAGENKVVLANQPTDTSEDSLAVATVGYVRKNAGGVKSIDTDYTPDDNGNIDLKAVRTEGDQTVNGSKTFSQQIYLGLPDQEKGIVGRGRVELYGTTPYIDFHSNNTTTDYTYRIQAGQNWFQLMAEAGKVININADVDNARLQNHPSNSTSTSSKAIATVGWVNSNTLKIGTTSTTAAAGNHTHSQYSTVGHKHTTSDITDFGQYVEVTDVESPGTVVRINGGYEKYACPTAHGHEAVDIYTDRNHNKQLQAYLRTDLAPYYTDYTDYLASDGFIKNLKVDGHEASTGESGSEVNFGLAANKWLKSDAQGHISTTNEQPIAVDTTQHQPVTATKTVVSSVTWNGTQIVISRENWQFVNGVLVKVTSGTQQTINTTTYTGS